MFNATCTHEQGTSPPEPYAETEQSIVRKPDGPYTDVDHNDNCGRSLHGSWTCAPFGSDY